MIRPGWSGCVCATVIGPPISIWALVLPMPPRIQGLCQHRLKCGARNGRRIFSLKEIFDRIELPPFEKIPDAEAIEAEKDQDKIAELSRWRIPKTESSSIELIKVRAKESSYLPLRRSPGSMNSAIK
jgi:hypothetical protein